MPILWVTARLERNIERSTAESRAATKTLTRRVEEIHEDGQRSLEEIRASFQALQAARTSQSADLIQNITRRPGYRSTLAALKHFTSVGTLSMTGARIWLGEPDLWCTILQNDVNLDIRIERGSGTPIYTAHWLSEEVPPERVFDDITAQLQPTGSYFPDGIDPLTFFTSLQDLISVAADTRLRRAGNHPGPARQFFSPQWMLHDTGLSTVGDHTFFDIDYDRTPDENWRKRLAERSWIEYDSFDAALTAAENLGWAKPYAV